MRVQFICRGNAYRSIIAEAYLKSLELPGVDVVSSGIVADEYSIPNIPVTQFTYEYLKQKGLEKYIDQSCNQLTQDSIKETDVIICMNQRVLDECEGRVVLPPNTVVWDINDNNPEETDNPPKNNKELVQFTDNVFMQIKTNVDELIKRLGR